jgi:hypothetical protein
MLGAENVERMAANAPALRLAAAPTSLIFDLELF